MMRLLRWARSEAEAQRMSCDGWRCNPAQAITHHHTYSVLMHREITPDEAETIGVELIETARKAREKK